MIPQLTAAGIVFRPLVSSADGRPHPAATKTLRLAAKHAWFMSSVTSAEELLCRWRHEIQIAIMRRRAAVLPRLIAWAAWLLTGQTDALPSSGGRELPLDDGWHAGDEGEAIVDADGTDSLNESTRG